MRRVRCPNCQSLLSADASRCAGCDSDITGELLILETDGHGRHGHRPSPPPVAPPRSRRLGMAATGAFAVFLVAGAVAGPRGADPPAEAGRVGPETPAERTRPPAVVPAGWTWRPTGPLAGRHGHVATWTGAEVVLWGGERPGRPPRGAAYDPVRDEWRSLARSPLANRSGAGAVWSGREVLVWGGINGGGPLADGAAYDPATDRWRLLAPAPLSGRKPLASAWTGQEFLVVGQRGYGLEDGATDAAAYDPATDRWRQLPPVPVTINEGAEVWTGEELVVYGGFLDRARRPLTPGDRALGAAFDPATGRWRVLPPAPLSSQALALAWDGRRVVAWDWKLNAAALDPAAGRWSHLPDLPLRKRDCLPAGVGTGRLVFAQHCGQAAVLEPGRPRWQAVPAPRGAWGAPIVTDQALVLWMGPAGRPHDGTWLRDLTSVTH